MANSVEPENNTPIEHQNVPAEHQGLHGFLYSSDNEHDVNNNSIVLNSDGTAIVAVSQWQNQTENTKVAGVYAVLDRERIYQYIGYSRDVLRSLKGHQIQNGAEVCAFIRVKTFKFPKREVMETVKDEWLAELDYTPTGNTGELVTWASTIGEAAKASMTEKEKEAYESKKLKLRKAMADTSLIDELTTKDTQSEADLKRRQELEAAVKNDDWSSVIES